MLEVRFNLVVAIRIRVSSTYSESSLLIRDFLHRVVIVGHNWVGTDNISIHDGDALSFLSKGVSDQWLRRREVEEDGVKRSLNAGYIVG